MRSQLVCVVALAVSLPAGAAEGLTPREGLKPFNDLVGTWTGTGQPEGTAQQKRDGFWSETLSWKWKFKGDDVWIQVSFDNSKHFNAGEVRYLPQKKLYRLTVTTPEKKTLTFEGPIENKRLVLERTDPDTKEGQRLTYAFLHGNYHRYYYEAKKADATAYKKLFQVGVKKNGTEFAGKGDSYPECVVSGGRGTTAVTHKGKTYYVCCSGCRDEFRANPEKYIKEFEEKQKLQKKD